MAEFRKRLLFILGGSLLLMQSFPQNTGPDRGAMALTEKSLMRTMHWLICLLHANELPLRHWFFFHDGGTSGPESFDGPIGKKITDTATLLALPIVEFEPLVGPLSSNVLTREEQKELEFTSDQNYAYKFVCAIATGKSAFDKVPQMALWQPGNPSHARSGFF